MDRRLTPLALAISSSFMISVNAWAEGGASGNPGDIVTHPNNAQVSIGVAGTTGANAQGSDGSDFLSPLTFALIQGLTAATLGQNASPVTSTLDGGGGIGGAGGGSVFGALTLGGSGSVNYINNDSANGGHGGAVSGVTIAQGVPSALTFTGSVGGNGGTSNIGQFDNGGGGGAGGAGGGSIFAAYSQGGAAGYVEDSSVTTVTANGGAGGDLSTIEIDLDHIILNGKEAGAGGQGSTALDTYGTLGFGAGGGGAGGAGGGSVFAAFSQGGAGGRTHFNSIVTPPTVPAYHSSRGGAGGGINNVILSLGRAELNGEQGGLGGQAGTVIKTVQGNFPYYGAGGGGGGAGGAGGGSVLAANSQGGAGGHSFVSNSELIDAFAEGGTGGAISTVNVSLMHLTVQGADGAAGGHAGVGTGFGPGYGRGTGGGGVGGAGGGSVLAASSQGGAGGFAVTATKGFADGAAGGDINGVTLSISQSSFIGASGGAGGRAGMGAGGDSAAGIGSGGGGDGGAGGASVFGALSQGGAGGHSGSATASANGGEGGGILGVTLSLSQVGLRGGIGGDGGQAGTATGTGSGNNYGYGGGGAGGAGGGSVFAAFSQGGAGGYAFDPQVLSPTSIVAQGGAGGNVGSNTLILTDLQLIGEVGGAGGAGGSGSTESFGARGSKGVNGGSIFGGYSAGGAGGYANTAGLNDPVGASGGSGGNTSNNRIRLGGASSLTGDIYGGYSQGGNAGQVMSGGAIAFDLSGVGGEAINNHITLVGTDLTIGGSVYGGFSIDGDVDFATLGYSSLNNAKTFTGNTLVLEGYRGSVEGVYNFENYDWTLPADVVNRDVLIEIRGNDLVDLNNTKHSVAMLSDGNRLNENDEIVLISKAQGDHQPKRTQVQQGHFIIYDALLDINAADEFVLTIAGKDDTNPATPINPRDNTPPAGRLNPTAKAFLQGRTAALASVKHGADMISDQLTECRTDLFAVGDGGSSRYSNGAHIKVSDQRLAIGGRSCFDLPDSSQLMLGLFAEHGTGNYHSRNHFADVGKVRGHGDVRYTGAGLVAHIDYAGTGTGVATVPVLASKDGLYNDAVLRAGNVKTDFASNQLIDASGKRAEYKSKSHYASAMLGAGYVWNLDAHEQVDLYARYNWDRLASDKVKIGGDEVRFGTDHSSRLRIGTRYHYAVTPAIAPYAGIAYEHEFDGKASGKVFDFDLKQSELKGSSGVLEVGVKTLPFGNESGWHLDAGVQGYFGNRKGATGSISVKYDF